MENQFSCSWSQCIDCVGMPYCKDKKLNRKQLHTAGARAIAEICNCVGTVLPCAIDFDSAPAAGGLLTKKNV